MLLAIDVGNTNTVLGLMPDIGDPAQSWRLSSRQERTADEWRGLLDPVLSPHVHNGEIDAAIIGSVVPAVTDPLAALCRQWLGIEPIIVNASLDLGITLGQKEPQSVGVDRIANAVAAWQITGSASIVIDFGTATKFEAIDFNGTYKGGIIAPGINLSLDALVGKTAKLPRIAIRAPETTSVIGRNTEDQMLIGVFWGYVAMMEGLIARMRSEIGRPAKVIATGGLAVLFDEHTRIFDAVDTELTLEGLALLAAQAQRA